MRCLALFISMLSVFSACKSSRTAASGMSVYALRLRPGQDLRRELETFARQEKLQAGFVVTCVGSLRKTVLRPANQPGPMQLDQKMEIVSLTGTLSPDGVHLHLAVSDSTGRTVGGHLLEGCEVYTTAEIVIGEGRGLRFRRETDPETTYKELKIEPRR
ncbi:MAG TPA: DNA-binding protein [Saprospiraceae bacterium]|nr:DNA-binding protein [Saprospiraceae bacterium]HNM26963.1 DNA-binding protein [Saprospiraceae bacterium]